MSTDGIDKETAIGVFRTAVHSARTTIRMARQDVEELGFIHAVAADAGLTDGAIDAVGEQLERSKANLMELVRQYGDAVLRLKWAEAKKRERALEAKRDGR